MPLSVLPLLLAILQLLDTLPFLTANFDVDSHLPILAKEAALSNDLSLPDYSLRASKRTDDAKKFSSQDLDGYLTTYSYLGSSCKKLISGSTDKLNYCAALSDSVFKKVTATTTEYTTKYYSDSICSDFLYQDDPYKYMAAMCTSSGLYSVKVFPEKKLTTDLTLARFTLM